MSHHKITADIFVLPAQGENIILYAPLIGYVCTVNEGLVCFLNNLENLDEEKLTGAEKEILNHLIAKKVIDGAPQKDITSMPHKELSPNKLTLFPSSRCNARCRYCYASNNSNYSKTMPWEIAKTAVEYFIANLHKQNKDQFVLEFHGGGEPFCAWKEVQTIVEYVEERCHQEKFQLEIVVSTNGCLSERQLQWIISHIHSLNISFDGLPQIQNYHRPLSNGDASFPLIDATMQYLDRQNYPYGIRCAVSNRNEKLLHETIDFITKTYRTKLIYLEPVSLCGIESWTADLQPPDLSRFAETFLSLQPLCIERGVQLEYSGANFERRTRNFCYVGTDNFAVTPDGYLTNCWEVTDINHPFAETFIFGRMYLDGRIEIDQEKLNNLQTFNVDHFSYCSDCFAKYHCAGDCAARLGHKDFKGSRGGIRCETNRKLIANRIAQLAESENCFQIECQQ